jgi:uncharacterized cupredoxin-like copper-binding protein
MTRCRVALILATMGLVAGASSVAVSAGAARASTDAGAGVGAAHMRVAPARMLVYAQEWSLQPSRPSLPVGRVTVQLWNRGEDAHDLRIRRLNASGAMTGRTQGVATTQSGTLRQATWKLRAGTYELYCSMPGHLARGMHVRIVVRGH